MPIGREVPFRFLAGTSGRAKHPCISLTHLATPTRPAGESSRLAAEVVHKVDAVGKGLLHGRPIEGRHVDVDRLRIGE